MPESLQLREPDSVTPGASPSWMSPPRVLLICDWFLKYVAPFAVALPNAGAEVALLCRDHANEFEGNRAELQALLDRLLAAGVELIVVPGANASVRPAALTPVRKAWAWNADVVHAQSEILDPRMLLAPGRLPLVLTVHDPKPHLGGLTYRDHHRILQQLWRRRANLILVHSERLAPTVPTGRRVMVIQHGMEPSAAAMRAPAEPAVLLFGRLEYYKGVRPLLRAMTLVWEKRPDVRLIVAGNGPERQVIPADPRIELFGGYVPEVEVDALFARASVAVLPYLDGSQSGVGLLALARGVPLVVTDVGGLPDLVPDETFVVSPGDPESLAAGLLTHLDHDDDFRDEMLAHARARFGWDAVARGALEIYHGLLAKGG